MKITKVAAREILDSRGLPTIECALELENGMVVESSVPSGCSRSTYEAAEMRDGGDRLLGKGVTKAVETIEGPLAELLIGSEADLIELDSAMVELDGTKNKTKLGANSILAVSMAVCRAQAYENDMEIYEFIAHLLQVEYVNLPFPMFSMIEGGKHANNGLKIQEFMLVPLGAHHFRDAMEMGVIFFHTLKALLDTKGESTAVGDEGGFAPMISDERVILDLLMEAMTLCGLDKPGMVSIGLDVAASAFYNKKKKTYQWHKKEMSCDDMIEFYQQLAKDYPIYSIEDGLCESDWEGWAKMTQVLGQTVQIAGDDLFASNANRILEGLKEGAANAAIIKPNQVGTITETLQAIRLCQEHDMNVIISHRSGETNDTFIVDLAVGSSAGQIKAGGCSRGERMAKYNRLLEIEDALTLSLLD